ncbi:MAG: hypothetical protein GY760_00910 [Deltaproteobacteria bacterium]|nr:hypothetical protein [Deltaproteobacteria bacterium]
MLIKYIPNILEKKDREEVVVEYKPQDLKTYFQENFKKDIKGLVPVVNGKAVEWDYIPAKTDDVSITTDLQGGNANIVSGIIGAALIVVGAIVPGAQFLIPAGVGLLVGAIVTELTSEAFDGEVPSGFGNSQTYTWQGPTNTIGEGSLMPVVVGEHIAGGVVIESFLDSGNEDYINVLLAVSEGEIENIDHTKIFLNKKEIDTYVGENPPKNYTTDSDGNFQYTIGSGSEIEAKWTHGTTHQNSLDGYNNIIKFYNVTGVQLRHAEEYIYQMNGVADKIEVNVKIPALYSMNNQGSYQNLSLSVKFAISKTKNFLGATEESVSITDKTQTEVNLVWKKTLPDCDRYYIKITRETADYTGDSRKVGSTYFSGIKEILNAGLRYPCTALLGVRAKATDRLSGSFPTITSIVKGVKFRDVRNISNEPAWTQNPADILYGFLINERFGLGRYFSSDNIDLESFQEFADFCDETAQSRVNKLLRTDPNYWANTEWNSSDEYFQTVAKSSVRYKLNAVFDNEFTGIEFINKILGSCRSLAYWDGHKLKVVIDKSIAEEGPVQMFTMGNIVSGSFEETYIALKDIPNQLEVAFLNEDNDFKKETIFAVDSTRLDEPVHVKNIQLYGFTDKTIVKREAAFALRKIKAMRKSISFGVGLQGVLSEVGDVILFQHDTPAYGEGGRISDITENSISFSKPVTIKEGESFSLRVRKKDNSFITIQPIVGLVNGSFTTIDDSIVSGSISDAYNGGVLQNDIFAFGELDREAKPYRINSITKATDDTVKITASEYNESIYGEDNSVSIIETNYSELGLVQEYELDGTSTDPQPILIADNESGKDIYYQVPPYVSDINLSEKVELVNESIVSSVIVDFKGVEMPPNTQAKIEYYEIWHSTNNGETWEVAATTRGTYCEIRNLEIANSENDYIKHHFLIKPYTNYSISNDIENSEYTLLNSIMLQGKVEIPEDITNFQAVQVGEIIKFGWDKVQNVPLRGYEIRSDSWGIGKSVIITKDNQATITVSKTGDLKFYIKAQNINGEYSSNPTEVVLNISFATNRNVIFEQDDLEKGWDGEKKNFIVTNEGFLATDDDTKAAEYYTGFISFENVVRSNNVIDSEINAIIKNEMNYDSDDVIVKHEISTLNEIPSEFIDIIRLHNGTHSENNADPTESENITYSKGAFHKGVHRKSGVKLEYDVSLPENHSLFFRYTPHSGFKSGVLANYYDGSTSLKVILYESGIFWLWNGSQYIELHLNISEGDDLIIGIGNGTEVNKTSFFAGNTTSKEWAQEEADLGFTIPQKINFSG